MTNQAFFYNIFAIPLLHLKVNNWEEKKKSLLNLYAKEELTFKKVDTVKNSYDEDITKSNELNLVIEELLKDEINEFNKVFNIKLSKIIQSWFQIEEMGMYHPIHNHGYGHFSSVCFIEFDSNYHLPTTFVSPSPDAVSGDIMKFVPDKVTEGSIIFFPSGLPHYSPGNRSDVDRKILSFNIRPEEYLTN